MQKLKELRAEFSRNSGALRLRIKLRPEISYDRDPKGSCMGIKNSKGI